MACDLWRTRLDAYTDGELSAAETSELDAHLRGCAACAADALRRMQWKRATMLAGKRFSADAQFRERLRQRISGRKRFEWIRHWAPQVVLAVVILGVGLFSLNRWLMSQRGQVLSEIADLHVATLASANPVDVASSDRHTVKPWFAGKLPFTFNLPELAGAPFTLLGGRLAYFEQAPAAQLIFAVRKHHISVFVLQDREDFRKRFGAGDFVGKEASFNVRSWTEAGLRYFAITDAGADDIAALSDLLKKAGAP